MSGPRALIVGGGIYGWSIALRLIELGAKVTVVDSRGLLDGDRASGGTTRILRLEYGDAAVYSELALRGRDRWRQIEAQTGTRLYRECGVLCIVPSGASGEWERASMEATAELGHSGRRLTPDDVAARWPAIRPTGMEWALFNPVGGSLYANRATAAVAALARAGGATYTQETVVHTDGRGAQLASGARLDADVVVVATGAWARRLVPELDIRSTRQIVAYLAGGPTDIPVFAEGAPFAVYGMPAHDALGLKVATHAFGEDADPDDPASRLPRDGEFEPLTEYAGRRFGLDAAARRVVATESCFYALTPTEDPVIDRLEDGRVVCAGFSGHGFKFGPVVGAAVAEMVLELAPSVPLERFRIP